jgi:cytoskeletal protein RodZ
MSQSFENTATHPMTSESPSRAASQDAWVGLLPPADPIPESSDVLVETYADRLMDELFSDVERILDGGVKLPEEPAKPETVSIQSVKIPQLIFPPALRRDRDTELDVLPNQPESSVEKHRESRRSLDRLLIGAGCASVLITLGVWLAIQQKSPSPTTASNPTAPTVTQDPKEKADNQFMAYLQRSLEAIQPSDTTKQATTAAVPSGGMPTVTVPGNPSPSPASAAKPANPQRVYIPIYQQPQSAPGGAASPPASVVLVPAAPAKPRVAAAPATPIVAHSLTGLLQLGDRSAALFEINGVTQRFQVGESIGTSGWTLVEISKNQAIVRRNGEVRSIFVGQKL